MAGLITKAIKASIKKGMTLKVTQRYLKIKHKIAVTLNVLARRTKRIKE
tara:strand:+ start:482 stop:628 length:147 start_codon:yes stop_codon:yes gene_type:complete